MLAKVIDQFAEVVAILLLIAHVWVSQRFGLEEEEPVPTVSDNFVV